MKRLYLLFILIAFCFQINAQENYRPFVEEGKEWKYYIKASSRHWDDSDRQTHYSTEYINSILTIKGDTIVDDIEYKKVYHDGDHSNFGYSPFFYGIIREENKKVYMRFLFPDTYSPDFFSKEILMYDFGINVGDNFFECYDGYNEYQTTMELLSIEKNDGKRIYNFSTTDKEIPTMQWVEGAGGFHGLGLEQRIEETTCIDCTRYTFLSLSCYLGEECLCTFDENGNLVSGIEGVKTDVDKDKSVYDLQGRRLSAEPERGVYIKDGKKIAR